MIRRGGGVCIIGFGRLLSVNFFFSSLHFGWFYTFNALLCFMCYDIMSVLSPAVSAGLVWGLGGCICLL